MQGKGKVNKLLNLGIAMLLAGLCLAAGTLAAEAPATAAPGYVAQIAVSDLPRDARDTLLLIRRGGPFRYRQDGSVFHNRERRLPARKRGYYREYTVPTPGARDRGARRIVAGGNSRGPGEYYYTDDHYNRFRRIVE